MSLEFQGVKLEVNPMLLHQGESRGTREAAFQVTQLALDIFPALPEKEGWATPQGPGSQRPSPSQAKGPAEDILQPKVRAQVLLQTGATSDHHHLLVTTLPSWYLAAIMIQQLPKSCLGD